MVSRAKFAGTTASLLALLCLSSLSDAQDGKGVVIIDEEFTLDGTGRFGGSWKPGYAFRPGVAGDWKSRGYTHQSTMDVTLTVTKMQKPFAFSFVPNDQPTGTNRMGLHIAVRPKPMKNIRAAGTYRDPAFKLRKGMGGDHTNWDLVFRSYGIIIFQPNTPPPYGTPKVFANDPSYYPLSFRVRAVLNPPGAAPPSSPAPATGRVPDWVTFPGAEWKRVSPEDAGLDAAKFRAWVESRKPRFGKSHGNQKAEGGGVVITRAGYIVHVWGDPDFKYQSASLGKTFTRMLVQLSVDKGKIKSVHSLVKDSWTGADELSPPHKYMDRGFNAKVTFSHLMRMRGGFPVTNGYFWRTKDGSGRFSPRAVPKWAKYTGDPDFDNYAHVEPGKHNVYSSGGYWRLSQALTSIWERDLKDVLDEHLFGPIGIPADRWEWIYGEDIRNKKSFYPKMPGYGDYLDTPYRVKGIRVRGGPGWAVMSAGDFARVGLLIATGGVWKGKRLISQLGGNSGVGAHRVEGWGSVKGKPGYFSFGKVSAHFKDPTPEEMASWVMIK